jgi:hypothetical protein
MKTFFASPHQWFAGTIDAVHGDGTFAVSYDDGDFEPHVHSTLIRPAVASAHAVDRDAQQRVGISLSLSLSLPLGGEVTPLSLLSVELEYEVQMLKKHMEQMVRLAEVSLSSFGAP